MAPRHLPVHQSCFLTLAPRQGDVETGTCRWGPETVGTAEAGRSPGHARSWEGSRSGAHAHLASARTQHRDMLRKELAEARVPRVASMLRSRSLVLKMSSIWRGTWLRSWLIWGR